MRSQPSARSVEVLSFRVKKLVVKVHGGAAYFCHVCAQWPCVAAQAVAKTSGLGLR
jgi:hypothetical protein